MGGKRRVVVTGIGAVTPLGNSAEETWKNLLAGESGIERVVGLYSDVETFGTLKDFNAVNLIGDKNFVRKIDPFAQFALAAALEAIADAKLNLPESGFRDDIGVCLGNCVGGLQSTLDAHIQLLEKGADRVNPRLIPMMMPNSAASSLASLLKVRAQNTTVSTACAASNDAALGAYDAIKLGKADIMVTGGTEYAAIELAVAAFANMGALIKASYLMKELGNDVKRASRPYDGKRDGFVMGSGAVVYVLESLESAKARGAKIYAELIGGGQSGDAGHITNIDESGVALAIKRALMNSGIQPHEVDYIAAHGTSTKANDKAETAALKSVFGEHAYKLLISSNKSMLGHLVGGAGAANALSAVKSIQTGLVHPTINYEFEDPECDLNYAPNKKVHASINIALNNAFGFGGQNSVLVFRRFTE